MVMRRFFGWGDRDEEASLPEERERSADDPAAETATVRRIVAQLSALPPREGRFLAGFAYILARAAQADLLITDEETQLMERYLQGYGGLSEAQAVLTVEMAKSQSRLHGGTEDYLVTREFSEIATEEQRVALVRCCFAVGATDASITAEESAEIREIARELGLSRDQTNAIANEFRDKLSVIQAMRRASGTDAGGARVSNAEAAEGPSG